MSEETIIYFGKKFFPHLMPVWQRQAVVAVLQANGWVKQP